MPLPPSRSWRRQSASRSWSSNYGGNPAVIGAVGMLAGFCGTLLIPMAANFKHRARRAARTEGPERGHPPTDRHGDPAVGVQRHHYLCRSLSAVELTQGIARDFARIALGHVTQPYPFKDDHVFGSEADVSCSAHRSSGVLRQLRLAQLRAWLVDASHPAGGLYPAMPEAARIAALAEGDLHLQKTGGRTGLPASPAVARASNGLMAGGGCSTSTSRPRSSTKRPAMGRAAGSHWPGSWRGVSRPISGC